MGYDLSPKACLFLIGTVEDELGKKRGKLIEPDDVEACRELLLVGLVETFKTEDDFWMARPTDAGKYFVGQHLGLNGEQRR